MLSNVDVSVFRVAVERFGAPGAGRSMCRRGRNSLRKYSIEARDHRRRREQRQLQQPKRAGWRGGRPVPVAVAGVHRLQTKINPLKRRRLHDHLRPSPWRVVRNQLLSQPLVYEDLRRLALHLQPILTQNRNPVVLLTRKVLHRYQMRRLDRLV